MITKLYHFYSRLWMKQFKVLLFILTFTLFILFTSCQFNPNAPFNTVKCDDGNVTGSNTQQYWDKWLMNRMIMLVPLLQSSSTTVSATTSEVIPLITGMPGLSKRETRLL
jgi:hypothetical protein